MTIVLSVTLSVVLSVTISVMVSIILFIWLKNSKQRKDALGCIVRCVEEKLMFVILLSPLIILGLIFIIVGIFKLVDIKHGRTTKARTGTRTATDMKPMGVIKEKSTSMGDAEGGGEWTKNPQQR